VGTVKNYSLFAPMGQ